MAYEERKKSKDAPEFQAKLAAASAGVSEALSAAQSVTQAVAARATQVTEGARALTVAISVPSKQAQKSR